ncbi:hypothetical protein DPMN_152840 [Dreissena polymorpha]|uniref:Uncharacterized protein n=1 Tax=Dreissena polymorpha TaxID=45954 RepID=A0A9D4J7Q1_DREPO|nr:hypothetical protein DPMN_152840 [Dreissena polymorpha]
MNVGPDNYTNKVLIEYDGTVEEAKEFGNNNNLKFLRHVIRDSVFAYVFVI